MKTVYTQMKKHALSVLSDATFDLVSIEPLSKFNEDGSEEKYTRIEAEAPRESGFFSRCRLLVKIMETYPKLKPEALDDDDFFIRFNNLQMTFIDANGQTYFKADNYQIQKDGGAA